MKKWVSLFDSSLAWLLLIISARVDGDAVTAKILCVELVLVEEEEVKALLASLETYHDSRSWIEEVKERK